MAKGTIPRARIMWFCTNCYGADGSTILTIQTAKQICEQRASQIEKYAMVLHDRDVHDEDSLANRESHYKQTYLETYKKLAIQNNIQVDTSSPSGYVYNAYCEKEARRWADFFYPTKQLGDSKEIHVHVLLKFKNARSLDEIARWFGVPMNMINILKGQNTFENAAKYLIHKDQSEKFQYESSCVIASFDYPEWLDNQVVKDILHKKYRISSEDLNDIVNRVATEGLSLSEAEEMVSTPVFLRHKKLFQDARQLYIYNYMEMPFLRNVFYVDANGLSGAGKSIASKALCKQFAREYGADITKGFDSLKDYIYKAGGKGVAWQRYDGQPIVLIDDREAYDMLQEFGGHDGVKNLLDPFPAKDSLNIKYGDVVVVAKYIVVNGIQSYEDFVNGLNGTYKTRDGLTVESDNDVTQYHRRITGIVKITEDDIVELLFNKGIMRGTREYQQYECIKITQYNFQRAMERLEGNALVQIESRTFDELVSTTHCIEDNLSNKISEVDAIPDEFENYGKVISPDEVWERRILKSQQAEIEKISEMVEELEEYAKFSEEWVAVNAEELVAGRNSIKHMATFDDWKAYGKHNHYDATLKEWVRI